jgi:hypothetical protein
MSTAQQERDELRRSIEEFSAGGYPVDSVAFSVCTCGNETFAVVLDDEVGVAATVCTVCEEEAALVDSDDHFADVDEVRQAECACGNDEFRAAVGFALDHDAEVRWVSVGLRCTNDGVAGVYVDWKLDYRPTSHLLAQS